jgi:hypothetical protein
MKIIPSRCHRRCAENCIRSIVDFRRSATWQFAPILPVAPLETLFDLPSEVSSNDASAFKGCEGSDAVGLKWEKVSLQTD